MESKLITVEDYRTGGTIKVPRKHVVIRVGVHAVAFGDGGALAIESVNQRKYDLPGGELEPTETAQDCLVRETAEETGLEVRPGRLVSVAEKFVWFGPGYPPWHIIRMYYLADIVGGSLLVRGNGSDSFGVRFVPDDELAVRACEGLGIKEAVKAARE